MPSFPLREGFYTDAGYRFRHNVFNSSDSWFPVGFFNKGHHINFFNIIHYNTDTVEVSPDHENLAKIFFRIDVDEIVH
jgi:hypothetical protein